MCACTGGAFEHSKATKQGRSSFMIRRFLLLLLLPASTALAAPCNVRAVDFLGGWSAIGKWAFFEQMSFEREGRKQRFDSWLHKRPDISQGQWNLDNCKLTILPPSGSPESFAVSFRRDRLVLSDGKTTSTYRKFVEHR
jgi:hypothetical protein